MIPVNELASDYLIFGIFFTVAADQGGLPVPGYPVLIAAAAHYASRGEALWPIVIVATVANLSADLLWFFSGRKFGARVLGLLCRVSMTPQSCVTNTRNFNERWGSAALIVTKFIPGVSAIAMVLAGDSKTSWHRFLIIDTVGALIWAGSAIVLGAVFPAEINAVSRAVSGHLAPVLLLAVAAYGLYKLGVHLRYRRIDGSNADLPG